MQICASSRLAGDSEGRTLSPTHRAWALDPATAGCTSPPALPVQDQKAASHNEWMNFQEDVDCEVRGLSATLDRN